MRWPAVVLSCALAVVGSPTDSVSQSSPPSPGERHVQLETRVGFLVTFAEGHSDRPLAGIDIGIPLILPQTNGPPGLTITGGFAIGFAEFFAEAHSESFRFLIGVEAPWAISRLQLAPHVQLGRLTSHGGDERSGAMLRASIALRVPMTSRMYFSFEPFAVVRLPAPDEKFFAGAPATVFGPRDTRWALEFGVLKLGWRL